MLLNRTFLVLIAVISILPLFGQKGVKTGYSCKEISKQIEIDEQNNNHPRAVRFLLFKEKECPLFASEDYAKLIFHLKNTISHEKNTTTKTAYIDTICMVYQRMETKKIYDSQNDLFWATYIIKSTKPDLAKADTLFTRTYASQKSNFSELHVNLYYFTLYSLYSSASGDLRNNYGVRLINTFYELKDHMHRTGMSPKATQNIETYLNNAIKTCDDIIPSISSDVLLSKEEKDTRYTTLNNVRQLMETKGCTSHEDYGKILDTLLQFKPTGEVLSKKAGLVLGSITNCGTDDIHQKLNAYYAKAIIDQAAKLGYTDPKQEALLKSLLPGKGELQKSGISSGQTFKLECWNVEITIP